MEKQPILLNQPQEKQLPSGPVFESGPGWGARIKNWLGRNFTKFILPAIILVLIIYGFWTKKQNNSPEPSVNSTLSITANNDTSIAQTVQRGDSPTIVARRALSEYLQKLPNENLTPGQKIFIEDELRKTINPASFKVGAVIEFETKTIDSLIERSKNLTKRQLDQWENYARKVKF